MKKEFLMKKKIITLLVPAYNESEALKEFYSRTSKVINLIKNYDFELLFVDDGSRDNTLAIIKEIHRKDKRISFISLSRNFGKEIAMAAGIDYCKGDALIIIDADLQDPPELINEMIIKWEEGFDDVFAQRTSRKGEGYLKKITSKYFYRVLARVSKVEIQKDTGDFRLLSKKAIEALKSFRESERYTKGLFSLVGMKKCPVMYSRDPRIAGQTKWNYFNLFDLAIQGITSFSIAPLKISAWMGFLFAISAFFYMGFIIFKTLYYGDPVAGYPSLVSIILFLGGIQLMSLGIIGEYVGRTFIETKNRPLYFVNEYTSEVGDNRITKAKKKSNAAK